MAASDADAQGRDHEEFICRLRKHWPARRTLGERVAARLDALGYRVVETKLTDVEAVLVHPHYSGSELIRRGSTL
jgi:hypothetical protein